MVGVHARGTADLWTWELDYSRNPGDRGLVEGGLCQWAQ